MPFGCESFPPHANPAYNRGVATLSLRQLVAFLGGLSVAPEAHRVIVDGREGARCTRASFRSVFGITGVEFPVEYAYVEGDAPEVVLTSRLRTQGLGAGGRERLLVNGKDVEGEDVLVSFSVDGAPSASVEFRWKEGGTARSVRFLAPLDDAVNP